MAGCSISQHRAPAMTGTSSQLSHRIILCGVRANELRHVALWKGAWLIVLALIDHASAQRTSGHRIAIAYRNPASTMAGPTECFLGLSIPHCRYDSGIHSMLRWGRNAARCHKGVLRGPSAPTSFGEFIFASAAARQRRNCRRRNVSR